MNESFDVIIVGAGPAGLKCAEVLGNACFSVLLLEKNAVIGPKVCAGGLTGKDIDYLQLPPELIEYKYREMDLYVRGLHRVVRNQDYFAYTIDRTRLGQWQLSKLADCRNVVVRTSSKVDKIASDHLMVDGKAIRFRILVGADGSNSVVRRYLGLRTADVDAAFHYLIPVTQYHKLEFHFSSRYFGAWYAWVFPHKDYVSVGCAANPSVLKPSVLKENFQDWIKAQKIDITQGKYEGFPILYDFQGYHFDNIWLVGDAAGWPSGFTGEGIYNALVSGEEVARSIIDASYHSTKIKELMKLKHKHDRILKLLIGLGSGRDFLFGVGWLLFSFPSFTRKMIRVLG